MKSPTLKWNYVRLILVLIPVVAFTACDGVGVEQRFPISRTAMKEDRRKFEGEWLVDDEILYVRFSDDGVAHLAGIEWNKKEFHLAKGELVIAEGGDGKPRLLCIRAEEDGKWADVYGFAQYKFTDGGDLVVWLPTAEFFASAVKDGRLQGVIEKGKYSRSTTISSSPEVVLKFISDAPDHEVFNYTEPIVLHKLRRK